MKKSKRGFFGSFLGRLQSCVPLFVLIALLVNVFVVYRFESQRVPQVIYSVRSDTASNQVSRASTASSPISSTSSTLPSPASVPSLTNILPRVACRAYYDYFICEGRRACIMWGRRFCEYALTSYGRIDTIFPDRILLADGSYIVNSKFIGINGDPRDPSTMQNREKPSTEVDNPSVFVSARSSSPLQFRNYHMEVLDE